jgi:hypothetical protein
MSRTLIATMLPLPWWEWSEHRIADRVQAVAAVVVEDAVVVADVDADTMGAVVDTVGMVVTAGMAAGGKKWFYVLSFKESEVGGSW